MELVNEKVEHIQFGSGVISEVYDDKIAVQFQDEIGKKMFQYPEAFEKFLKAVNPELESDVLEECRKKQEKMKLELEREAAEREEDKAKAELMKENAPSRTKGRKKKS